MRVNQLIIENVASLRGKHLIDFNGLLTGENLFAITGPTGSGKSTLLSAITLALYGNTHKPTLSQNDFVTLGEKKAMVELTFSLGSDTYVAFWECRVRKGEGALLKNPIQRRLLYKLTTQGKVAIEENAQHFLRLSFDQFCKTIVLNQGEFSQFLMSTFSERKNILERLYQGELLGTVGQLLKEELSQLQRELEQTQAEMRGHGEIQEEILHEQDLHLQALQKKLEQDQQILTQHEILWTSLQELHQLTEKEKNFQQKKEVLVQQVTEATSNNNELKQTILEKNSEWEDNERKGQLRIPLLRDLIFTSQIVQSTQKSINEKKQRLQNIQEYLQELAIDSQKFSADQESLVIKLDLLSKNLGTLNNPTVLIELKTQWEKLQIIVQEEAKINERIFLLQEQLKQKETSGQKLAQEVQNIKKNIENFSQQELELKKKTLQDRQWETEKKKGQLQDLQKQILQRQNSLEKHEQEIQLITQAITQAKQQLVPLEKELELYQLSLAKNQCHQQSLKEGVCVVCGNLDLPSTINQLPDVNHTTENLNQKLSLREELKTKITQKETSLELFQEQYKAESILITELQKQEHEIHVFFKSSPEDQLILSYKKAEEDWNTLIQKQHEFREKEKTLQQERSLYQKAQEDFLQNQKEYKTLTEQKNTQWITIKQLVPHYPLNLEEFKKQLSMDDQTYQSWKELTVKLQSLQQQKKELEKNEERHRLEKNSLQKQINAELEQEKDLLNKIKTHQGELSFEQELLQWENKLRKNNTEKQELSQKLHMSELALRDEEKNLQHTNDQLKDIELTKINLLESSRKQIRYLLLAAQLPPPLYQGLEKFLNTPTVQIEVLLPGMIQVLTLEKDYITQLKDFYKNQERESIILQEKISQLKTRLEKWKILFEAYQKSERKLLRLQNLSQVLGKDEFRNFALGLIEEQLIIQANVELKSLCDGRYELMHFERKSGYSHDFYVIDHYRGGLTRKVSTLSGGETFLVSLALALSLSEMSRGQAEIDSFFIDEGFGSLDQDSLEEVLEVLYTLRGRGKQIGIISHIKSLTSRLPININLNKSQMGESQINILYN